MLGGSIVKKIMVKPITIGIAGGTGAGKTTLANAIYKELGGQKKLCSFDT